MYFLTWFLAWVCLLPLGAFGAESFIVENGVGKGEIVIADQPPRTVKMAARELQTYVEKISGARLPIVTEPDAAVPVQLYVGPSRFTEKLGLSVAGLRHGAFRMVSGEGWLAFVGGDRDYVQKGPWPRKADERPVAQKEWDAITGETFDNPYFSIHRKYDAKTTGLWEFDLDNAGTFNAVTRFLHELGVRWYLPGELGEIVPERASIALPQVDRTVSPDFAIRNLYQMGRNFQSGNEEEILWQMRLGTNQGQDVISFGPNVGVSHGIGWVVRRRETKSTHPEMYRVVNGQRQTDKGVPCLSSEELFAANLRFLRVMFDTYNVPMPSVMPTDGFTGICHCEKCRPQETPGRGRFGTLSDYVWGYVVKVAREIEKTHPDRKIHCLAYTTYLLPPEKIGKLPSNVVVGIAQNRSNFGDPEWKAFFANVREGWREKITSGVPLYQYEYYLQDHPTRPWHGLPVLYPRLIVDDLRSLKGISMGEYAEVFRGGAPVPTNLLNIYVTARFLWDVQEDLDAMLDEYYHLFYGPAAQPMKAYHMLAESAWRDLDAGQVEKLFSLLQEAKALAGESVYGERVALQQAGCEEGLKRTLARKKEADTVQLGYLDESGTDPTANPDALIKMPLKDLLTGETATAAPGEVSLGWTGSALYVRVACEEDEMASLRQHAAGHDDSAIFRDDTVSIVVQVPEAGSFEVVINPQGVYADLDRSQQGLDGIGWNGSVKVSTVREEGRWIVETTLPAADLGAKPPTGESPWKLNVGRSRPRGGGWEISGLAPTGRKTIRVPERMINIYIARTHETP